MFNWEQIATIVVTLIGAASSERAWRYWQNKQTAAIEDKNIQREDQNMYRDDLREEVKRLRNDMIKLYAERDEERTKTASDIADLREQLAVFKTRVEHLEKENTELRDRLASWKQKATDQGFTITD
tara:strand:+ start:586 stop:963 length:378 start_codon:yes stop_codon:yes gene_type:complete